MKPAFKWDYDKKEFIPDSPIVRIRKKNLSQKKKNIVHREWIEKNREHYLKYKREWARKKREKNKKSL